MRIIQLAAEFSPIAKAGGLGEVIVGLSRELTRLGEDVQVIIPKYDFIDIRKLSEIKMEVPDFKSVEKGCQHANAMWSARWEQVSLHLLDARHPAGYFHRGKIYGCEDDAARFIYFSRAALEYLKLQSQPIDVLHLHDWHTALAAVLARDALRIPIKTILLTIHSAEYQGKCAVWDLDAIGLKGAEYLRKEKLKNDDPAQPKLINLLKGGIVYADLLTTVSPSYAKEILTSEMGYCLDAILRQHKKKLTGILNGVDLELWNPGYYASDPIEIICQGKEQSRARLQERFHLTSAHRPWLGGVTRLVAQKGPELLEKAIDHTIKLGGTFVLLGSSPIPQLQAHFERLKANYKGSSQVLLHFEYDEELARSIYAALDFLIIPSLHEPCGLTQMIGMRYGTVPIARATGGLKDTIFDSQDPQAAEEKKNGFLFSRFTAASMIETLDRAIRTFRRDPALMRQLIRNGMKRDWSWKHPAQEYLRLYRT